MKTWLHIARLYFRTKWLKFYRLIFRKPTAAAAKPDTPIALSLKAPTIHNPLLKYPRNTICFCRSGKKFKRCHMNQLPRTVIREQAEEAKALMKKLGYA